MDGDRVEDDRPADTEHAAQDETVELGDDGVTPPDETMPEDQEAG